jgi:polar amino acid transport system permease protein
VEVFRAGLQAIPRGLVDAGLAIGLSPLQRMLYVTLPTMFRLGPPPLGNAFISLFKDTAIAFVIAVPELQFGANWIYTNTFRIVEVYAVVTPMYLVTGMVLLLGLRLLERRGAPRMRTMLASLPFFWQGLLVTLQISAITVAVALAVGVVLGVGLTYGPRFVAWPIRLYSDVLRGVPLIVLIFAVYYGLPAIGMKIGSLSAALFALCAFESAHVAEVARGALQSIHPGQAEAGKAIGLTFRQRMLYVIFPQAPRRFLPPWINTVVDTVEDSALVSLVGIVDLMLSIQQVIGRTFKPMPLYVLGALIYFAINYTLSMTGRLMEARFAYARELRPAAAGADQATHQVVRRLPSAEGCQSGREAGRGCRDHRLQRQRQDHAVALYQSAGNLRCRLYPGRRRGNRLSRTASPARRGGACADPCRHQHGVSVVQPVPASDGGREHHARPAQGPPHAAPRGTRAGRAMADARRPCRQVRQPALRIYRRAAAACRHRPRRGDEPEGAAAGRDQLGARTPSWLARCCAWCINCRGKA